MAFDTILQQGRFTADGTNEVLVIRSDLDWIHVRNETVSYAAGGGDGAEFFFQRGMTDGRGVIYTKEATIGALVPTQLAADAGFRLINSGQNVLGAAIAVTAATDAVGPVFSTGATGGLATGSIVRISNMTGATSLNSFDFEIDTIVGNTSFDMRYNMANAPGIAGAGSAFYRIINFEPQFYPRHRFIVDMTAAASAVVTTSVQHGYTVGQEVRFNVPSEFGMVEMDGLAGTITATTVSTITLDIDSSAFTAFTFPLPAAVPFSYAQVVPLGEDTGVALANNLDILASATDDTGFIGVELIAGTAGPAGVTSDVIYWVAGKSFSVSNS